MHTVYVRWEGPYAIKDLPNLKDTAKDYGLYQIYAHHPVYGSGALVYIGQAIEQTFGARIAQHRWESGSEPDPINIAIYVGRLVTEPNISEEQWKNDIYLAEKLLIHHHAPAYNSTHIMSIHNEHEVHDLRVVNFGAIRSLASEASGYSGSREAKRAMSYDVFRRSQAEAK